MPRRARPLLTRALSLDRAPLPLRPTCTPPAPPPLCCRRLLCRRTTGNGRTPVSPACERQALLPPHRSAAMRRCPPHTHGGGDRSVPPFIVPPLIYFCTGSAGWGIPWVASVACSTPVQRTQCEHPHPGAFTVQLPSGSHRSTVQYRLTGLLTSGQPGDGLRISLSQCGRGR